MNFNNTTVLLVDDDPDSVDLYKEWLSDDYNVRAAHSGEEALQMLNDEIDIAVLDMRMNGMSGYDLFLEMEREDVDCRTIIVTGLNVDVDVTEYGFDYCLTKPVKRDEFRDIVDYLVLRDRFTVKSEKYQQLRWKYDILKNEMSPEQLEGYDTYEQIKDRLVDIQNELNEIYEKLEESPHADLIPEPESSI